MGYISDLFVICHLAPDYKTQSKGLVDKMKNILRYSIVIIAMLFSVNCFAEEGLAKTLVIEVENATANGDSVAGDEVVVDIYHHDTLSETLKGEVTADNNVIFEKT